MDCLYSVLAKATALLCLSKPYLNQPITLARYFQESIHLSYTFQQGLQNSSEANNYVSGHASSKSALIGIEENTANLCGDIKPSL